MKITLERIEGDGPRRFAVLLVEDDNEGPSTTVGTVVHVEGKEWEFVARGQVGAGGDALDSMKLTILADTEEELHAAFRQRFGITELQADRLRSETMEGFSSEVYTLLNVLADRTGSMEGHVSALAQAVAMVIVEDSEDPAEFQKAFFQMVGEHAAQMRAKQELDKAMKTALKGLFSGMRAERDPTKH